jgi:hypothetical protein
MIYYLRFMILIFNLWFMMWIIKGQLMIHDYDLSFILYALWFMIYELWLMIYDLKFMFY